VIEVDTAFRALHSAVDVFVEAAADHYGINRNDQRCLELLDRRGPMTAGALADAAGLSAAAVTKVVDRLTGLGYVERARPPQDRRQVIISTTAAEQRLAREVFGPLVRDGLRLLAELPDDDLETMLGVLRRAADLNAGHAERVRNSAVRPPRG
jgi:DNA-binding MarR family transcriptional regulator